MERISWCLNLSWWLKSDFPSVPIIALTATLTPSVEQDVMSLLRNPIIKRASVNRPNITLNAEEMLPIKSKPYPLQFADRVSAIINSSSSIVYTDFIADIGPIVSALADVGVEAVGYHGEMDGASRHESYLQWKSRQAQVIVATRAFRMGIDKHDIRHVIRHGVPESMLSWAQELGRAGRDGNQACATILYRKSDISHANPWVMSNVSNRERCKSILSGFSQSWKYVQSHLAGICRRKLLIDMFGEKNASPSASGDCCDVCMNAGKNEVRDFKKELCILIDAIDQVGCKGEVKISEWIRGSNIPWTNEFNKKSLSYGNHRGKPISFWRSFLRQCSAAGLVDYELKSMIKPSGYYAVNGVYYNNSQGREAANSSDPVLLPVGGADGHHRECASSTAISSQSLESRKRIGKGSNILSIVRNLLTEPEDWLKVEDKSSYHFPGVYKKLTQQHLYYLEDFTKLGQCCDDPHFLWVNNSNN